MNDIWGDGSTRRRRGLVLLVLVAGSLVIGAGNFATVFATTSSTPSAGSVRESAQQPASPRTAVTARAGLNAATAGGAPQQPGSGGVCPAALTMPAATTRGLAGLVSHSCGGHIALATYGIPGLANSDTRTTAPAGDYLASHPAATVQYVVSYPDAGGPPGWFTLPPPTVDDSSVKITTVHLANGLPARVTTPVGAAGMYRMEWIKAGSYYQLLSAHGHTSQGTTGVPQSTLLAMANGIR